MERFAMSKSLRGENFRESHVLAGEDKSFFGNPWATRRIN